ncbi:MAG: TatD family hydrolase [Bacteroidales bacterium]|jgi:TatD DNase family protein|nr:TatD family hydrolase [Bacteroidales bacterium]MDD4361551.1 TatD family hydrolase [Bacteroidales bacterium]
MIDTHTHLYLPEFRTDIEEVLKRTQATGITQCWIPGIDADSLSAMDRLYELIPAPGFFRLFAGLHPCEVKDNYRKELDLIRQALLSGKYNGIGEIGLDRHWDLTFFDQQMEALRIQLDWALEFNMPVLIHTRDAFEEIMPVIRPYFNKGLKGIFHSYAGTLEQARELTAKGGFYLGINGSITYKNSAQKLFLNEIPLRYIVTETDAPYLSPVPHRGKRNEPSNIPLIVEQLAVIYKKTTEEIKNITSINANCLFN